MHKDLLDRYNKIKNSENQFLAADFDIENASNYRHNQLKNQLDLNLNVADLLKPLVRAVRREFIL